MNRKPGPDHVQHVPFLGNRESFRNAHEKRQRQANVRTAHATPSVPMSCGLI